MPHTTRSNYFSDGKTIIDFVIVISKKIRHQKRNLSYIKQYVEILQECGLRFEANPSSTGEDLIFIKINLSSRAIKHYANVYNINIKNFGHRYMPTSLFRRGSSVWDHFETPLTEDGKDIFIRQKRVCSMERILIANELLNDAIFNKKTKEIISLKKLIDLGIVQTAYPLHDGDYHFDDNTHDDDLNDRQLLFKYWANFSLWYKKQPLNLIEKYYGTEVAFYFAWLGFYNQMLISASIFGILCFLISLILLPTYGNIFVEEICSSPQLFCHFCANKDKCELMYIKNTCSVSKFSFLFDNSVTVIFAVFTSFWASVFVCLWKKMENVLKITWNVEFVEADTKIRNEYKEKATAMKKSAITGDVEPSIPLQETILHWTITSITIFFLLSLVFLALLGFTIYRIQILQWLTDSHITTNVTAKLIGMITTAILQVIFIKLFSKIYGPLCLWLTQIENPRTQVEFDTSVITKKYFLSFANNYAPLFYIAFVKGRLYRPFEDTDNSLGLKTDICYPTGCVLSLCVQLAFLLIFKSMVGNIMTLIMPKIKKCFFENTEKRKSLPQYELEFKLCSSDEYLLTDEYIEMMIQYGFVTFFVTAFPLAPLCALINNLMELRLDAYKILTRHRRPVPKKRSSIGTWNYILKTITLMGTATNAFILAFTSDFVSGFIFYHNHGTYRGYINATMSRFEFKSPMLNDNHENTTTVCYYRGLRNPPEHVDAYDYSAQHFYDLGMRLLCVIIFEHIVFALRGFVMYWIPAYPSSVLENLDREACFERDRKIKRLTRGKEPGKGFSTIKIQKNI